MGDFDSKFQEVPEGKHAFAVMGTAGDTKVIWDPDSPVEVEAARAQFNTLTKNNKYRAFYVSGKEGRKDEVMTEFDPAAGRIILVPPMAGG